MNRTNVAVLLIATVILIAALSGQTKQLQPSAQPGRYQLFAAEYTVVGPEANQSVILRIDTQTGNVDQWMMGRHKNGDLMDKWIRIGEEPAQRGVNH
jgi:hypothetical protein